MHIPCVEITAAFFSMARSGKRPFGHDLNCENTPNMFHIYRWGNQGSEGEVTPVESLGQQEAELRFRLRSVWPQCLVKLKKKKASIQHPQIPLTPTQKVPVTLGLKIRELWSGPANREPKVLRETLSLPGVTKCLPGTPHALPSRPVVTQCAGITLTVAMWWWAALSPFRPLCPV